MATFILIKDLNGKYVDLHFKIRWSPEDHEMNIPDIAPKKSSSNKCPANKSERKRTVVFLLFLHFINFKWKLSFVQQVELTKRTEMECTTKVTLQKGKSFTNILNSLFCNNRTPSLQGRFPFVIKRTSVSENTWCWQDRCIPLPMQSQYTTCHATSRWLEKWMVYLWWKRLYFKHVTGVIVGKAYLPFLGVSTSENAH